MLRIRYHKHKYKEGCVISGREFISNRGARYRVIINYKDMEFYIRNERTKEYVKKSTYKYTNENALKRAAKGALEKLGVSLKTENRWRTFGRCEKGTTQSSHIRKTKKDKIQTEEEL